MTGKEAGQQSGHLYHDRRISQAIFFPPNRPLSYACLSFIVFSRRNVARSLASSLVMPIVSPSSPHFAIMKLSQMRVKASGSKSPKIRVGHIGPSLKKNSSSNHTSYSVPLYSKHRQSTSLQLMIL